jgi:hypothetical protein
VLRLEIAVEGVGDGRLGGMKLGEGGRWLAGPRDVSSGREGDDEGTGQTTGERGREGEKRACDCDGPGSGSGSGRGSSIGSRVWEGNGRPS